MVCLQIRCRQMAVGLCTFIAVQFVTLCHVDVHGVLRERATQGHSRPLILQSSFHSAAKEHIHGFIYM